MILQLLKSLSIGDGKGISVGKTIEIRRASPLRKPGFVFFLTRKGAAVIDFMHQVIRKPPDEDKRVVRGFLENVMDAAFYRGLF